MVHGPRPSEVPFTQRRYIYFYSKVKEWEMHKQAVHAAPEARWPYSITYDIMRNK